MIHFGEIRLHLIGFEVDSAVASCVGYSGKNDQMLDCEINLQVGISQHSPWSLRSKMVVVNITRH